MSAFWPPRRAGVAPTLAPFVATGIRAQQDRSERLIGWVQLGLVSTFGALFALAPRTVGLDPWQRVAFWALIAYFGFTLLRLALSYRMRLPAWFLAVSIVADMALLIAVIWSFHIDYAQHPAFYLKAPTLLYVFIFIALRALRFEPGYVALAGIAAAVGWAALVAFALLHDYATAPITRNYVTYLMSNAILLGAEFDKIISILAVTAILALALARARALLVSSVREQVAASALSRFFAPEIAERIRAARQAIAPGQGEAREAAILTTDLRGFTALAMTLPPDDVMALLVEYQSRLVPIVQKHGGSIDKFLGDGILATFGAAVPSASAAADALRAAMEIQAAAQSWEAERAAAGAPAPRVGTAVTTGRVVFGAVGDSSRLEFTVIGDAVNLAAKLDKHSKVEGVRAVATAELVDLAARQGYAPQPPLERRPRRDVAGVAAPVDLAVLAK